jgi:hypothetical protein
VVRRGSVNRPRKGHKSPKRVGEFDEYGAHWVTLADPEGNVFDLAEIR